MKNETPSSLKSLVRGGQITLNNIRMFNQINGEIFKWSFIIFVILWGGLLYFSTDKFVWDGLWQVGMAKLYMTLGLHSGKQHVLWSDGNYYNIPTQSILTLPYYSALWKDFFQKMIISGILLFMGQLIVMIYIIKWLSHRGAIHSQEKIVGGDTLEPWQKVKQKIIQAKQNSSITIDGFPLIKDSEVRNFLIHGTQGSGKSQLIRKFLTQVRKRGEKAIVYDKGCDLIPSYYQEGDIILNPFDERCANWSLWKECKSMVDYENMANALIPKQGNESDPFWVNAARTILANGAYADDVKEKGSIIYLLSRLLTSSLESMADLLKGTVAESLVDPKIEKTAISIKSVLATYLKSLCFLDGLKGEPFSIREWIANPDDRRWLFISSRDRDHMTIRPLISMWLDIATSNLLSLSRDDNRRVWVVLDEIPTLHKLPYLPSTFAEARKFGGCFIIGLQDISQLQGLYGAKESQAISGQCNTRFFFRTPDSDTAIWSSQNLGKIEIEDPRESYSYGSNTIRDGINISHQRSKHCVVDPSEILNQDDLQAYVRLPGKWPITQLTLKYEKSITKTEGFIERFINENALHELTTFIRKNEMPISDKPEKSYRILEEKSEQEKGIFDE